MTPAERATIERAKRINRTWITQGTLAENAEKYLNHLADFRPQELPEVCAKAVQAAKDASGRECDPKPCFYASLFSTATREERDTYLREHFFTRLLSAEYQQSAHKDSRLESR